MVDRIGKILSVHDFQYRQRIWDRKNPHNHCGYRVFAWSMGYKKDFFAGFAFEFEPLQNDISLRDMIYGWHRMIYFHFVKIWYNIRSFICRRHISPTEGGYHIEDISPVPAGTDIIEKRQVSVETCRFSWRSRRDSFTFSPTGENRGDHQSADW